MSEIKFDFKEWEKMDDVVKMEKADECHNHWKYLLNESDTFGENDPDSSEYTWKEVYKRMYTSARWGLWGLFDFEKLYLIQGRLYAKAIRDEKVYMDFFKCEETAKMWMNWANVKIAGDTDFNFKKDARNQKYIYYRKLIEDKKKNKFSDADRKKYLCKLDWCEKRNHSLENFTLMFTPGGMNNCKNTKRDRIDRFLFQLNKYFISKDNKIFSHARKNKEVLEAYLALFEDIYDYCKKIYIMDKSMVERFLKSGEKEDFKTGEEVVDYMQLAEDYWKNKHNFIFHN